MNYKIVFTAEFEKEIKKLSRKYPSLPKDFSVFLDELSSTPNQGTALGHGCYKVRFAIQSKKTGNQGGARIITCVKIILNTVILVSIYDKSARENISNEEIKRRLRKHIE